MTTHSLFSTSDFTRIDSIKICEQAYREADDIFLCLQVDWTRWWTLEENIVTRITGLILLNDGSIDELNNLLVAEALIDIYLENRASQQQKMSQEMVVLKEYVESRIYSNESTLSERWYTIDRTPPNTKKQDVWGLIGRIGEIVHTYTSI